MQERIRELSGIGGEVVTVLMDSAFSKAVKALG